MESTCPSAPPWGPNREVVEEGGEGTSFCPPFLYRVGYDRVWSAYSGFPGNGLVTCRHRNLPWPASGRWAEKQERPNSSRRKALCDVGMQTASVGGAGKLGWRNHISFPAQPVVLDQQEGGVLGPGTLPRAMLTSSLAFSVPSPKRSHPRPNT